MKKFVFFILCLEGAILSFNVSAVSALVPSVSKELLTPLFITAKIIWLYMLPYGVFALFYGPLIRVFEAKYVELICIILFSFSNLLAGLSKNIHTLFLARFLSGVFGASVIPLTLILISKEVDNKNRGKFIGLFFSITFISSLLGLFLSGVIYWRFIFLIPAFFGFVLSVFMHFCLPKFFTKSSVKINYLEIFKNKSILFLFIYIFFISMFYHAIQNWLSVYFFVKFGFKQFLISILITLTSLSGIFGEFIGGIFSDKFGRIPTINLGIFLMILSIFLLIFKLPFWILIVIMIIWGIGWTFNHAGVSTLITTLPEKFLNESASLNSSIRFISGGLGVTFGGLLMEKSFTFGFIFVGFGLLFLLFLTNILIKI